MRIILTDRASIDHWQARVNRGWRFYFTIKADVYYIQEVIPPPK